MDVVLIGAGMVAQTHVLALRDNDAGLRLAGVLGRDAVRTQAFCTQASATVGHDVTAFTDIEHALAARPDMAILITPPNARADYATALAGAGIPTLMEKPLERTLHAAKDIVGTYADAKVPAAVCFQHRTRAASRALKAQLEAGALGEVIHAEIRVPWWRDQTYYDAEGRGSYDRDGGGVMINQAIHTLDLALWLAGPIAQVQAQMRTSPLHRMEAEDIAAALLTFRSGASGILSASTAAYPGGAESIALTTSRAQVLLQGDMLQIGWHDGRIDVMTPDADTGTGGGADPMAFSHGWHQSLIEDFARCAQDGSAPLAPLNEALHVHAVIHAMEQAARTQTLTDVPT
ncbi:Gfo/Idh/MocA family oxidoreductase [uncultured Tateyamaria sp.]|uniref:Gfo/Idh/MocA family protein n=1 Tax=uncultured Tateyamaria sp. TaxID=455651 RepID=UPI002606D08D|nr:Gfo/Idh/MocA family oxidoreductase [uncultured Tateyamaria sp.]